MRWILLAIKWVVLLCIAGLLSVYLLDRYIDFTAKDTIYTDVKTVPHKKAALLLGTAKYIAKGKKNYFYVYRIRAAVALWKAGKVDAIVVSGDNATKYYNETIRMENDLVKAGIPKKYISADYAGFRTLDSVVRAEAIFDLEDYIIVSQKFHLERALFIAKAKGQKVIGFAAKELEGTKAARKMRMREYLARVKAFLDVYVLGTEPRFYGKKEKVNYRK
ncbi:MAG TPA: vancomycin resistance protein [Epsilonproteobacteria bacterium]|nr:vancomycin resistance protein [Campylobacterota bacterium]